ncbi:MAG: hypothetical protein NUV63_02975 [Gallionella sp.]|nr:hypothetical protein [Gallionella sp.]
MTPETTSTEDVALLDETQAIEAQQFMNDHYWRLKQKPKLLQRLQALIARQQVFIVLRDAQGRPERVEPSYPLLEIMAELAR